MSTVLILGGKSDVAQALAYQYAKRGDNLILAARDIHLLTPLKNDINIRFGTQIDLLEFDAADYGKHGPFVTSVDDRPDIIICAFGYLGGQEVAQDDWNETVKILTNNFIGAVSILNHLSNMMERKGKGAIVGISSVAGDRGRQSNYIYGSAKAGFTAYLSGLRNRMYKHGVHVMTVRPGYIQTKMIEHLQLPGVLLAKPDRLASKIISSLDRKRNNIYYLPIWRYIMTIIRMIPEFIFKRLNL